MGGSLSRRIYIVMVRASALVALLGASGACASQAIDVDPAACPHSPPCQPSACAPIGTHCEYYVPNASHPSQLCDCVIAPDGGTAEGVWQCGGC